MRLKIFLIIILFCCNSFAMAALSPKIIGGEEVTDLSELPWMVSIQYRETGAHFCTGMQIDENWVLTAAHCIHEDDYKPSELGLVIGSEDIYAPALILGAELIVTHNDYNRDNLKNDIALIKLEQANGLRSYPKLATSKEMKNLELEDAPLTIMGWGYIDDDKTLPTELMRAETVYLPWAECKKSWPANLLSTMLCIEGYKKPNETNVCNGDSGGPLIFYKDAVPYLVGITSYGESSCRSSFPSVFTKISEYLSWIEQQKENPDSSGYWRQLADSALDTNTNTNEESPKTKGGAFFWVELLFLLVLGRRQQVA